VALAVGLVGSPGIVRDEQQAVEHQAHSVVHCGILAEGPMATLVGNYPDACAHSTLRAAAQWFRVEIWENGGRGQGPGTGDQVQQQLFMRRPTSAITLKLTVLNKIITTNHTANTYPTSVNFCTCPDQGTTDPRPLTWAIQ